MKLVTFILTFYWVCYEAKSQMTCGPRVSPRMIQDIPCDMSKSSFCQIPGGSYPWSSVRRYIYENQGLMRRMYGDQRQSFILRNEIDDTRDKYDTVSYFEPSARRPVFGPRSLDTSSSSDDNNYNNPSQRISPSIPDSYSSSTSIPSSPQSTSDAPLNVTPEDRYESTPVEEMEVRTDSSLSSTTNSTNNTSESTPVTPSSTTTVKTSEDVQEEPPNTSVPRKGVNACPVKEEVIAPFWANNTRGETLALLNVYPFEQYVHWEKCSFEFDQMFCREGCRCEQQYRLHRLLAFDPKNECRGIFADWFRFPSCCICVCYDLPDNPLLYKVNRRKGRI